MSSTGTSSPTQIQIFPEWTSHAHRSVGLRLRTPKHPSLHILRTKKTKPQKWICIWFASFFCKSSMDLFFFLALTWLEMMMSLAPWLFYDGPSAFQCLSVKQIGDRMIICHSKYLFVQVPTAMEMILVQLWGDKSLESRLYYFHCEPRLRAGRPMAGPNL